MTRGELWLSEIHRKRRPVLVLTRPEVIDVRELVTVAEVTTHRRGIASEVAVDADAGLREESVVNCDGLYTVPQGTLSERVGVVSEPTMQRVCRAVAYALGC